MSTTIAEFDANGYPTEKTLERIEKWPMEKARGLFEFLVAAWKYRDYAKIDGNKVRLSTGGWSGNESLVSALERNFIWGLTWQSSRIGGHYEFELLPWMK